MKSQKSILFVGNCYYNHYYLARELKKLGWRAHVLSTDLTSDNEMYYHGHDFARNKPTLFGMLKDLVFFIRSLFKYKIFHFSNMWHLQFPPFNSIPFFYKSFGKSFEINILKIFGKKVFYTNNGCMDGVLQSTFSKWKPHSVCNDCAWKENPNVCSDGRNQEWGQLRNRYADYIGLLGGNRADFNDASHVHEAPWMYSLDKNFWFPEILVPSNYKLPYNPNTIKVFHSVGHYDIRNHGEKKATIKSTEIWIEVVNKLKSEGLDIELIFFKDVPNKQIKYYQAQADVFVDMLTFGFFGANIREAMMLGKPSICFLRPEWLESMSNEIPEYVRELPVVSAMPDTAYETLKDLVLNEDKRLEIGRRMRRFGLKWHASDVAATKANEIYSSYL